MIEGLLGAIRQTEIDAEKIVQDARVRAAKITENADAEIAKINAELQEEIGRIHIKSHAHTDPMPEPNIEHVVVDKKKLDDAEKFVIAEFNKRWGAK